VERCRGHLAEGLFHLSRDRHDEYLDSHIRSGERGEVNSPLYFRTPFPIEGNSRKDVELS
jgi:hypothetical protein